MGPWEDGWEFYKLCAIMVGIKASYGIRPAVDVTCGYKLFPSCQ